jgi:hypothetical protein
VGVTEPAEERPDLRAGPPDLEPAAPEVAAAAPETGPAAAEVDSAAPDLGPGLPAPPAGPSFGRSIGTLWVYTILRFLVFGALFGLLWFFGVPAFLAAVLALLLSLPLSYVVLAKPRAALAETIEARMQVRRARHEELNARLHGDDGTSGSRTA